MNTVIDSNGWLEYFTGGRLAGRYAAYIEKANTDTFFTPTIVLYEVYKKLTREKNKEAAIRAVTQINARTTLIQLTEGIALRAAEFSLLTKLPMADSIIKATADQLNAVVVTGDPDFKNFPNVQFME